MSRQSLTVLLVLSLIIVSLVPQAAFAESTNGNEGNSGLIPLFPWLSPGTRTEEPAATPTPGPTVGVTPTPTATPTEVPAVPTEIPVQSEWLTDFTVEFDAGMVRVDFADYALSHPGTYYVYTAYETNDYYTWYTRSDTEHVVLEPVVPAENMLFGVYYDAFDEGRPGYSMDAMKRITSPKTKDYAECAFKCSFHAVSVVKDGSIEDVSVLSVDDVKHDDVDIYAYYQWYYDIKEAVGIDTFAVLQSPSGIFYTEDSGYNWATDGSGKYYRYLLNDMLDDCADNNDLTNGVYSFSLYSQGQLMDLLKFEVGEQRQLLVTPEPFKLPTKSPTPKPTKTPTPRPTKTPTPKPTAKPRSFRILDPSQSEGYTTVTWEDNESMSPYTVYVQHESSQGLGARQNLVSGTYTKSVTSPYVLVPGEPYKITVRDKNGNTATYNYRPPQENYPDFKVTAQMELRIKGPKISRSGQKSFSASEIEANISDTDFFAYVRINYSRIKYARNTNWTGAVTMPNGDVYLTSFNPDTTIPAGKSYLYWNHYSFNSAFNYLLQTEGRVLTGEYTWTLYFDGQKAGSGKFNVR